MPDSNDGSALARASNARLDGAGSESALRTTWPDEFASIVELFPDPFIILCPIRDRNHQIADFEFCDANKCDRQFQVCGTRLGRVGHTPLEESTATKLSESFAHR